MQRPVLLDERAAIDACNLPSGESLAEHVGGLRVRLRLGICGVEHRVVQDEEIGIRGGKAFAFGDDGGGHGAKVSTWLSVSSPAR